MKVILILLMPLASFCQTTLVAHGDTLWLKNNLTNDSSRLITARKLTDTTVTIRTWTLARILDSNTTIRTTITNGLATKQNSLGYTPYNSTNPSGYISAVPAQTFASLTGKPTTIAGYGITDAFDGTWNSLTGKPTTTSFLSNSTNKNFVTDAQLIIIGNTVGSNNGDNAVNSTYANDYRAGNFIAGTNYLAPNGSIVAVTGILPFASNAGSSAATSATTGTMTVNMATPIITITPTNACTFNGSGGVTGQRATFVITTSGVSSFTLTWGTNYRTVGTLATGTTTAKIFCVSFLCTNGTQWVETSRTIAQ